MRLFALLLLFSGLGIAAGNASCPWISEPTAAGLLGGPVQARTTSEACEFSRLQHSLRIETHRMSDPKKEFAKYRRRCGKKAVAINAIGNQAFACPDGSVLARVRDVEFTVVVTSPSGSPAVAQIAAEHVAGALF